MGSFIQKILQGRGDKKGQSFLIQWGFLLLCTVLIWLGLQKNFPVTMPVLWFSASASIAIIYALFHFSRGRKSFQIEFLFSLILLCAGLSQAFGFPWLKLAYFPFIITTAVFYEWKTVIPLAFLAPIAELAVFFQGIIPLQEIAFAIALVLTAVISSAIIHKFRKEKDGAVATLKTIRETAQEISPETTMESLTGDEAMSHYFASLLKTDEEISELLQAIKKAIVADSSNFFTMPHGRLTLRCSTEKKGDIILTSSGIIMDCMRDKKLYYAGDAADKKLEIGYIKSVAVSSILAVPVMEGSALLGVLNVDSSRYHAFSESDRNTVQMFTNHLARILERERIYPKIKRDYNSLKILNEESSKLVSSLDVDVIAEKLCEGVVKIASSDVFFFLSRDKQFKLIHPKENTADKKKLLDLRGTIINMALESIQPFYMPDVTDYRIPIMPFKTGNVKSFVAVPLRYKNKLQGLLVMLSGEKNFLDTSQIELLKVICSQASTSIENAQLHAEIDQLATTDGLTGLNNHRVFQEKLSEELKRLNRSSGPISLMLADIDFFKKVNDTYGHPVGDLVLKGVAKIIKETIRDIDIAARYGGEEFAIILPGTDTKGARNIAERLRKAVASTLFSPESAPFKVTLSIGIATSPSDSKTKEELIEKADQALYHAKHNGRNQSAIWNEIRQ